MAPQNFAAWLMKKQETVHIVRNAPYNKPEADEIVIQTKAVAINPVDLAIQKTGIIIDTYPAILGCDVAGVVEEVGSSIKDFKSGDRVIGLTQPTPGGIYKYSGFQQYVVLTSPKSPTLPNGPMPPYCPWASIQPPPAFFRRVLLLWRCRPASVAKARH